MVYRLVFSWRGALLGVLATLATVGFAFPAAASAAGPGNNGGPGNSRAAKDCEKGGYVNYATTTGTRFRDEGQCVRYAAQGGRLVPLPDLVPLADCTSNSIEADCMFRVKNIGIGPAVGQVELQAALTMNVTDPASFLGPRLMVSVVGCERHYHDTTQQVNPVLTIDASVLCNDITIQPGETYRDLEVLVGGGGVFSPGTIAVNAAVVTPILERNTNNNTFSQTFTTTGMCEVNCV